MAMLIMLNNYFHDLAAAVFFVNVLLTWFYVKVFVDNSDKLKLTKFIKFSTYLSIISLLFILLLGVPRAIFYRQYEWVEAAGRGQVTALFVKHIILSTITFSGLFLQLRLYRKYLKQTVKF